MSIYTYRQLLSHKVYYHRILKYTEVFYMCCDSVVLLGILYLLYASGVINFTQLLLLIALASTTYLTATNSTQNT